MTDKEIISNAMLELKEKERSVALLNSGTKLILKKVSNKKVTYSINSLEIDQNQLDEINKSLLAAHETLFDVLDTELVYD